MHRIYKIFTIATTVIISFIFTSALYAYDSAYVIDDVKVDVTAESAAQAREQAFTKAQILAFEMLMKRLLSDDYLNDFEVPEIETISALVLDFEIKSEKLSAVRYVGEYVFRFKKSKINAFLTDLGARHTDVTSLPVLVIPFYREGNILSLWSSQNPWKNAWSSIAGRRGLVPVVVPVGDISDMQSLSPENASVNDWSGISDLLERYDAQETMITVAHPVYEYAENTEYLSGLEVNIYSIQGYSPVFVKSFKLDKKSDEEDSQIFNRAATDIRNRLQKMWKEMTLADPNQQNNITLRVAYSNIREWVAIKKIIESINAFENVDVVSVTGSFAEIAVSFRGDINRLRIALAQNKIALEGPKISFNRQGSEGYNRNKSNRTMLYDLIVRRSQF